ncbi:MAG: hypothetical protein NTX50_27910 [Candidatus Sumerlaeota bacterium]|nr:hypothetical protein [Candidatus Sumerlaeota bacterium]
MQILFPESLAATLDAVNEALFFERTLSLSEREKTARWIAGRQGGRGSYADMPAPTEHDFAEGAALFTGEKVHTRAGIAHTLGEEACRALLLLDTPVAAVREALQRASDGISERLSDAQSSTRFTPGWYCCGKCSVALWRHLAAGGLKPFQHWMPAAMENLRTRRDGKGRWHGLPFHYTLLALSEMAIPASMDERRYAAPVCERLLTRQKDDILYVRRRRRLAEQILRRI